MIADLDSMTTADATSRPGHLRLLEPGLSTTVQDLGRPGWAHLGVGRSGAIDHSSHRLANRLVGNSEGAATLETTLTGCMVEAESSLTVAVTGAQCPVDIETVRGWRPAHFAQALSLGAGQRLRLGLSAGSHSYLAVAGGVLTPEVMGSRSQDLLGGIGGAALAAGTRLPIGTPGVAAPAVDVGHSRALQRTSGGPLRTTVRVHPGQRRDWFTDAAWRLLISHPWEVAPEKSRVGMRLAGPVLERSVLAELPSEPMVLGAIQVPSSGQPMVFLADHPTTGGYPVIGVVDPRDMDRCGQLVPGDEMTFAPS